MDRRTPHGWRDRVWFEFVLIALGTGIMFVVAMLAMYLLPLTLDYLSN
jgi:hypothetical protein